MTRNAECRRQVHEVLCGYDVGWEFVLDEIITDMTVRNWPERNKTKRQPVGRVANILGEYRRRGFVDMHNRTSHIHGVRSQYIMLKRVE